MNALIVLSLAAVSSAQLITPYGIPAGPIAAGAPILANTYAAGAPIVAGPYAANPALAAAALAAPSSQYQAQDEFGNVNYGYANINSAKKEVGNAYGGVVGSYSYVDANGIPQTVEYVADALGFRVKATNLPVAPVDTNVAPVDTNVAPVFNLAAPEPVMDTEEVAAAKAEFKKAFDEAANREKRSAVLPYNLPYTYANTLGLPVNTLGLNTLGYNTLGLNALNINGLAYGAPLATPLAAPAVAAVAPATYAAGVVSAPATREATLTKIKLNPGHAVAYRVD